MPWFLFAILSAIGFGICNIFDKFILERRIKNFLAYFVIGGFFWLVFALIILFFSPLSDISLTIILLAILTGFLMGTTWLLYFKGLTKEEVSRVVALYYLFPIFVALLARIFLKEEISFLKWLAIILAIFGAILISLKKEIFSQKIKLSQAFLIILLASFIEGILETIDKYVLYKISPWNLIILGSFGFFMMSFIFFISSKNLRKDVGQIFSNLSLFKLVLIVNFIYFLAVLSFLFAASLVPITYVAAISVSQPLFLFLFTIILSLHFPRFLEEPLDKKTILVKVFSITLIISGILIVILT